jgi:hypothetical protein
VVKNRHHLLAEIEYCVVCVAVNDHCATVVEIIKNYGGKPFDIHVSVSAP